ncbi:MAG: DUF309 domain-containing protein [Candidatus Marinimicrobia bacterium]|nr:DUF309 domain-containing protein [Candidatus Neomarinimicrobiota bacterium]
MTKENQLFNQGITAFNKRQFYDAHEYWEELWLNYKLDDAKFIQGLIQLAVSYFHFFNKNLNGARSMMKKCITKFEPYHNERGMDIQSLKKQIITVQNYFNKIMDTSYIADSYIITLKVTHK